MLTKVFETRTAWYRAATGPCGGYCSLLGSSYPGGEGNHYERMRYIGGLYVLWDSFFNTAYIHMMGGISITNWPGWGASGWRWDHKTGEYAIGSLPEAHVEYPCSCVTTDVARAGRFHIPGSLGTELSLNNAILSRARHIFFNNIYGQELTMRHPTTFEGLGVSYSASHFGKVTFGAAYAIDELENVFLNVDDSQNLSVYTLSTGELQYTIGLPADLLDICLEDERHAYVLCENRLIILVDYIRGEVLGSTRLPPLESEAPIGHSDNIRIAWDPFLRRLLLAEKTPEAEDGASTIKVLGFNMIPKPLRLTTPIPLRVPRQGTKIPFLVQVLGDLNEGVGGHIVTATVSGGGSLAGVTITDPGGNGFIPVAIEGHPQYVGAADWEETGSPDADPPHAGDIHITAEVTVAKPHGELL